jgi:hypothetical protein
MRLVPDQRPPSILRAFEQKVRQLTPPGVRTEVRLLAMGDPVLVSPEEPAVGLAARALQEVFGRAPVYMREGGSIPVVAGFVNAILRRLAASPPPLDPRDAQPAWLREALGAVVPEAERAALFAALVEPAPLAARVNTARTTREALLERRAIGLAGLRYVGVRCALRLLRCHCKSSHGQAARRTRAAARSSSSRTSSSVVWRKSAYHRPTA